jgi:hypothetical protein
VATPFSLTLTPGNTAGRIEVNGMTATGVYRAAASIESWAEEPVESVTMRGLNLEFAGGGRAAQAPVQRPHVDARELPVWGIYTRNVRSLELQDVRLNVIQPDGRPALMMDDVGRLELDAVHTPPSDVPALALFEVRELSLRNTDLKTSVRGAPPAPAK